MNDSSTKRIHRIYSILLSIVIVITGICLMVLCINIYRSGKQSFSREVVANAFAKISILVYICLFMTILGFIFDLFSSSSKKTKGNVSLNMILENLQNKKDMSQSDIDIISSIVIERRKRRLHSTLRMIVVFISSLVFLLYATNKNNYHQSNINHSMIKAMIILMPCLLISFVYSLYTVIINEKSMIKEIDLLKKLPPKDNSELSDECNYSNNKKIIAIRIAFLLLGAGILIYGYKTGGTHDVLTKAVNICTECIGLG